MKLINFQSKNAFFNALIAQNSKLRPRACVLQTPEQIPLFTLLFTFFVAKNIIIIPTKTRYQVAHQTTCLWLLLKFLIEHLIGESNKYSLHQTGETISLI